MRAVVINNYGGPDILEVADIPVPELAPGEVLLKVHAAGINPADGKWRRGMYKSIAAVPMPHILGYDVAGTIEGGEGFAKGARVAAMLNPFTKGGYAEYASVDAANVTAIPDEMSFETAAQSPVPASPARS
jgi:NADPH2:quinone reductase